MDDIKRCRNCLISSTFPGVKFDDSGMCNYCNSHTETKGDKDIIKLNKENIDQVVKKRKGISRYDAIVAYSGGKDSSYTIFYLKEKYELKILAFLIDNDFVSERALKNAKNFTENLEVDLAIFKPAPSFMHNMYNKSLYGDIYKLSQLTRANAACLSCITLINSIILNEAIIRKIPIIAGGYIGGQIPIDAGNIKTDYNLFIGLHEKKKDFLSENIDKRFSHYLNINPLDKGQKYPAIINPMLAIEYNEEEIITIISKYGWVKPDDTGQSSSNCMLNDFAIAVHFEKYKYHSYESEICLQVRRGNLSKKDALSRLTDIRHPSEFEDIKLKLRDKKCVEL